MPTAVLKTPSGEVHWWKPSLDWENAGDFLSGYFLKHLFSGTRIEADIFHLIGSVITGSRIQRASESERWHSRFRIVFWGCGCRDETGLPPNLSHHATILGTRGPLSAHALGLPTGTPIGDPGLLLPLIYTPKPSVRTSGKMVFVPHVFEIGRYGEAELAERSGTETILSPLVACNVEALEDFIDQICSSEFVLASSLHGAIIAAAYGVPFSFFDCGYVDVPFKWRDFSASIGVGTYFPRRSEDARRTYEHLIKSQIRRPPLEPILSVAPFIARKEVMARAISHSW